MRIKLDDKHYLNSDRFCFWISCEYKGKTGKTTERRVSGYHTTFEKCVDSYIDREVIGSTAENITRLRDDIARLKKTVKGWEGKEK